MKKVLIISIILFFIISFISCPITESKSKEKSKSEIPRLQYETFIPMRDGNNLSALIIRPNNNKQYPTILVQTPYNKNNMLYYFDNNEPIASSPYYAYVIVDWRGFFGSAAAYVPNYDLGDDGYDLVEWIAVQPWSDGKIGTWGVSALGAAQYKTMVKQPPHLICSIPIFRSLNQTYFCAYPGGVYRKEYVEMLDLVGFGLSTIYKDHPFYDTFWILYENLYDPVDIQIPVFYIGGWYDLHNESFYQFFDIKTQGGPATQSDSKMLIGSWIHFAAGDATVIIDPLTPQELLFYDNERKIQVDSMKFFDYHLRGILNEVPTWATVRYHDYTSDTWNTSSTWPPTGTSNQIWYLQNDNTLTYNTPPTNSDFSYTYTYNPDDPVPTIAGPTLHMNFPHGPHDMQPIESRSDVIVFTSPVLSTNLVARGTATVKLFVSTDQIDTDFEVILTDLHPDGTSLFIAQGIRRLKLRNSYDTPTDAIPGTIYELDITLRNDLCYTFETGHMIRLLVTSSNFEMHDRNSNNGDDFSGENPPNIASNNIWIDTNHQSYLVLPVN